MITLVTPPSTFLLDQREHKKTTFHKVLWTTNEVQIVRENINRIPYARIALMLHGRSVEAIKTRASILGISRKGVRFPKRSLNENFFSKPTLLSSYWAGFIAADGCVLSASGRAEIRIGINQRDLEHLRRFSLDVGYDGPIAFTKKSIRTVSICGAHQWVKDLKDVFNIGPRKTFTLHPPYLPQKMALAYSIGYIDGDGCWATMQQGKYLYLIVVGTWMADLWREAGAKIGIPKLRFQRCWRLSLGCSKAEGVAKLLEDFDVPRLQRKWRVARHEATGQKKEKRNS
jgi:hypothetical protein